jgi:hypothetical protein
LIVARRALNGKNPKGLGWEYNSAMTERGLGGGLDALSVI